ATLDRGYRLVELLKQDLNSPLPVEEQVIVLYAGTKGYLDRVPVEEVKRYEADLLDWFRSRQAGILDTIRTTGNIGDEDALKAAIAEFTDDFAALEASEAAAEAAQ